MTSAAADARELRLRVGESEHRWLERGDGLPVVLVHGIPTSPELWRHVLPLVDAARLLAWEMPGCGRSWHAAAGRDISVGAQADRLLAWRRALDVERAVMVGHDLGGGVVQIAAARAPQRCAGIVLTNVISYDSWPIPEVKAMRTAGAVVERLPPSLLRAQLGLLIRMGHDDPTARASHSTSTGPPMTTLMERRRWCARCARWTRAIRRRSPQRCRH